MLIALLRGNGVIGVARRIGAPRRRCVGVSTGRRVASQQVHEHLNLKATAPRKLSVTSAADQSLDASSAMEVDAGEKKKKKKKKHKKDEEAPEEPEAAEVVVEAEASEEPSGKKKKKKKDKKQEEEAE